MTENMLLLLSNKENYCISSVMKDLGQNRICLILLSNPIKEARETLRKNGLDISQYYFIDILSSHYMNKEDSNRCIFLNNPDPQQIIEAARHYVKDKKCNAVVFDNIISLLLYHDIYDIDWMASQLKNDERLCRAKKIIVACANDIVKKESERLVEDLKLFVDCIHEV